MVSVWASCLDFRIAELVDFYFSGVGDLIVMDSGLISSFNTKNYYKNGFRSEI